MGGWWFLEGTTSLDRRLWIHHVRNGLGIGGRIADLPNPDGSGTRIQVPKDQVRRYTWRSYEIVSRRFQESVFLGFLLAVGGTVTAAFFLRESGRSATEDRHIRGATLAPVETVVALARASKLPYDFTLAGVPLFREAETDHVLVCGAPGSGKGVAIKELLDQIRARGDRAILYDPSGEYVQVYYRHGKDVLLNPLDARSPAWTLWGEVREAYDYASLAASIIPENEKVNDPFWRGRAPRAVRGGGPALGRARGGDQRGLPPHDLDRAPGRGLRPGQGHGSRTRHRSRRRENGHRRARHGQHQDPRMGVFAGSRSRAEHRSRCAASSKMKKGMPGCS